MIIITSAYGSHDTELYNAVSLGDFHAFSNEEDALKYMNYQVIEKENSVENFQVYSASEIKLELEEKEVTRIVKVVKIVPKLHSGK